MLSHLFSNWKFKMASWPYSINGPPPHADGKQITFVLQKSTQGK
jgi:hypothetical protein